MVGSEWKHALQRGDERPQRSGCCEAWINPDLLSTEIPMIEKNTEREQIPFPRRVLGAYEPSMAPLPGRKERGEWSQHFTGSNRIFTGACQFRFAQLRTQMILALLAAPSPPPSRGRCKKMIAFQDDSHQDHSPPNIIMDQ